MRDVVVVEAVRSAVGRRNGGFAGMHPADLLGEVLTEVLARSGVDPTEVGQVVGGCVGQVGMQAMNVTRNAWLGAGLPLEVAATTVDSQCGSSQQATALAAGLVASGSIDVAIGCGVEVMTRVTMGSTIPKDPYVGKPLSRRYRDHYEATSQFEGAERIAESVAHHARAVRPVRQGVPGSGGTRVGRGSLCGADPCGRCPGPR